MKVIKILLEFEGWDPNGSKKTLKKVLEFLHPNLIHSPDYNWTRCLKCEEIAQVGIEFNNGII